MKALRAILFIFQLISGVFATAPCPTYPPKFFTQKLDHASNDTTTFQQQYQLVTDFFKPGGPILYTLSAEVSVMQCVEMFVFLDYSKELGGIATILEHRFFGESFPTGLNDSNATPMDFAPLTLENVLLDSVTFIDWIKTTVPGANQSKAIIQGGSYAGTLATWGRLRYPDTFYGTVPSAPQLKSWGPLLSNPYKYNWWEMAFQSYEDESFEASAKIKSSLQAFNSCITANNCSQILPGLNACSPQPTTKTFTALLDAIFYLYQYAIQLSYGVPWIFSVPYPHKVVTNQTIQANNTGAILRIPGMVFNDQSSNECWNWTATLKNYANPANNGQRAFGWILCHYFPSSVVARANSQSSLFPPSDFIDVCGDPSWEVSYFNNSNTWWTERLGITDQALLDAGRILFTKDAGEPTASVGAPPRFEGLKGRNETRTISV